MKWKATKHPFPSNEALIHVANFYGGLDYIRRVDFPDHIPDGIDKNVIYESLSHLKSELKFRLKTMNLRIDAELTCREFISPFLFAAICSICK